MSLRMCRSLLLSGIAVSRNTATSTAMEVKGASNVATMACRRSLTTTTTMRMTESGGASWRRIPPAKKLSPGSGARKIQAANCEFKIEEGKVLPFPTIEQAKELTYTYRRMDNHSLVMLGGLGEYAARKEILIRHIMALDEVPYEKALKTFGLIQEANHEGMYLVGLPFQLGALLTMVGGMVSIPLVFHLESVEWFNDLFVTADEPPLKELETWLEVGSWSWNWMEPVLGTSTFVLLCMQYFRINMDHLGIKPYTHRLKKFRSKRLVQQFPRYDREVLMNYSESADIYK